jgi:DNA-binding NarL/FixJ family response regulator
LCTPRAARETLIQALDGFETLGARAWAEQARAELARVSGKAARTDLTPTELRVARLVADGLSNKQAAAALFVSVKAVEKNLSRIYTKLGITSRAQLVRTVERGELPPPPETATKE